MKLKQSNGHCFLCESDKEVSTLFINRKAHDNENAVIFDICKDCLTEFKDEIEKSLKKESEKASIESIIALADSRGFTVDDMYLNFETVTRMIFADPDGILLSVAPGGDSYYFVSYRNNRRIVSRDFSRFEDLSKFYNAYYGFIDELNRLY